MINNDFYHYLWWFWWLLSLLSRQIAAIWSAGPPRMKFLEEGLLHCFLQCNSLVWIVFEHETYQLEHVAPVRVTTRWSGNVALQRFTFSSDVSAIGTVFIPFQFTLAEIRSHQLISYYSTLFIDLKKCPYEEEHKNMFHLFTQTVKQTKSSTLFPKNMVKLAINCCINWHF